ncbi:MAG TPA: PBP1A family penicillin-binding protein [Pyrinomonadaceae bacterium]|nr:PBP1A family penicillin-binding protein [Pyrinomonadaceae bacterium]
MASYFVYTSYRSFAELVDRQIAGGYLRSRAGIYASPRVVEKGAKLSKDHLIVSLQRAGYVSEVSSNIWSGSFSQIGDSIRISPRQGTERFTWVDINFDKSAHVASMATSDGLEIPFYALEPELLTADANFKIGEQKTITFRDLPPALVNAILAIEDRRFFQHSGLDVRGIGRAFLSWISDERLKFRQGGSTITQQLVKNTYLTPEKTIRRKFNEALIAVALEQRLSKEDIFALYCNEIYLGQRDGVGIRGMAQAARIFFGKDLNELTVDEAATIAGMIQSPSRYAPDRHPEAARERRNQVLAAMANIGLIDQQEAQVRTALPMRIAPSQYGNNQFAPYYVDAVNRAVENAQPVVETGNEQNMRVQTTIDPDLQAAAESSLRNQLARLEKARKQAPEGALVAIDVHTGHVLAMVGGRNYSESQLNRATDAKRQPGSVYKPFVYATALEAGLSPVSLFRDEPQIFAYGAATYSPRNYGRSYSMKPVMMRDALVRSLNTITVDVAMRVGPARIASTAKRFGLTPPQIAYPSLALGTTEVTPLKMAAAYAAFANGGTMIEPMLITGAEDTNGKHFLDASPAQGNVIKATTAYMITDMLKDVIARGTARKARGSIKDVAIAGKTGTSRDGWFVGYTPNLVCAVWIGFDDNEQLGLTGAEAALPAWIDFVTEAVALRPSLGGSVFPKPGGLVTVKIDPESGFLAGANCPYAQTLTVAARFAPVAECYIHAVQYEIEEDTASELGTAEEEQLIESSDGEPIAMDTRPSTEEAPPTEEPTRSVIGPKSESKSIQPVADQNSHKPSKLLQPLRSAP